MTWFPGPQTRAAVLRHPFVLAGLAVVALLGLTAGILVLADSLTGGEASAPSVVISPVGSATAASLDRTSTASGATGRTRSTTSIRQAPGNRAPVLGTLPAKSDVEVDGRTTDTRWLRIVFPPESTLHGWLESTDLDITGDPTSLVVATAEPPVIVELPTQPPSLRTATGQTPTAAPGTPTKTPVAGKQLPDLVIGTTPTLSGNKLFVTVVNQGPGEMKGDLVVAVFNADGSKLLGGATVPRFTLAPGRSIDIGTGYKVTENQSLLLVVDPNGDIDETDNTNNRVVVALTVGDQPPTAPPFSTPAIDTPAVPPVPD